MKKLLKFFLVIVGVLFGPAAFAAGDYVDFTVPENSAASLWDSMEAMLGNMTLFFGVVVVLAILVTGFFLGRKWLRRVG